MTRAWSAATATTPRSSATRWTTSRATSCSTIAAYSKFRGRAPTKYGDVETINERWGLTYWSHRLSGWDDLWPADGNTVPSYDLAWRAHQARITTEFIAEQAAVVRELARDDQFTTTCMALSRPAFDAADLNRALDVAAVNPYYPMQDALTMPEPPPDAPRLGWAAHRGAWAIHLLADLTRGAKQGEQFLVTETNALAIGESHNNYPAFDGQWRQAAWALVARGARMVEYWHWHSIHFGHEAYWLGVLNHDGEPGRCYAEVARIGAEFKRAKNALAGLKPDADVGLLYSSESRWAMGFHPPLGHAAAPAEPDPNSYDRIVGRFYEGLFGAGLQTEIVYAQDVGARSSRERLPVLLAPALYVAPDALLDALDAYARAGGHLVLGFRTGYADDEARPRPETMPGRLREAVGATYSEYTNLTLPVELQAEDFPLPDDAAATAWADALVPEGADVLVRYEHPHLGRWAAVTSHAHGRGRVTYVGTLPDRALAVALARWLRPQADAWAERPDSVTVTGGTNAEGQRVRFVSNWSWDPARLNLPVAAQDVLSGDEMALGTPLDLGAWDIRVLLEEPGKQDDEEGRTP